MLRRALVAAMLLFAAACPRAHDDRRDRAATSASASGSTPASASGSTSASATSAPLTCRALQGCTDACADAACAEACVRRLTAAARPAYDALQACVVPACANADGGSAPCRAPGSFACKMCVLSRCAAPASTCMTH